MPDAAGTEKFMVVIAVVAILFIGIVGYMISLDLKLKKLEKN
jgi:CcmD family protein